jgi:hypothetical protein
VRTQLLELLKNNFAEMIGTEDTPLLSRHLLEHHAEIGLVHCCTARLNFIEHRVEASAVRLIQTCNAH